MLSKENVIRIDRGADRQKLYVFHCLTCPKEIRVQGGRLPTHSGKCMVCAQRGKPYEHCYNELKATKSDVTITYEQFVDIITDSKCEYCEIPLHYNPYTRDENKQHVSRAYQLDRMNSSLGYSLDNVVPCCWECNRMKSNKYSHEEFLLLKEGLINIRLMRE